MEVLVLVKKLPNLIALHFGKSPIENMQASKRKIYSEWQLSSRLTLGEGDVGTFLECDVECEVD